MDEIQSQMTSLRLSGMARCWLTLLETRQTSELSLADGLQILLHAEQEHKSSNRNERLIKKAKFRYQASYEELVYRPERGLDKALLTNLATGTYINEGRAVIITGAAGTGKSFVASALGNKACRLGYKVLYFNMQKISEKFKVARLEGTHIRLFDKLAKTDLIILDDFGLTKLEKQQQSDLMEIIEDRHGRRSTIIVSQIPVRNWFEIISNENIADAFLDRLVHTSYRFELKGESMRKK